MGEPVAPLGGLADDPRCARARKLALQVRWLEARHAGKRLRVELDADDRSGRERLIAARREALKPAADHLAQARRDLERGLEIRVVVRRKELHDLFDEEGVSVGLLDEQVHQLGGRLPAGKRGNELTDLLGPQPAER